MKVNSKRFVRMMLACTCAANAIAMMTYFTAAQAPVVDPTPAVEQTPTATASATQESAATVVTTVATPTVATAVVVTATVAPAATVTASIASTSSVSSVARPFNVAGVNLLTNPGHEHPGANFAGRSDLNVTWNWNPFWAEPPSGIDPTDANFRTPAFSATFARDNPERVRSGAGSDRWRNTLSVNRQAGIMQYVADLPVGAPVRFTSWLQLWSNDEARVDAPSKRSDLKVRVCIDQDGGPRDLTDPNLVCSDWKQPFDTWEQLSVDGIAKNSVVNAIIWSTADTPVLYNDVYADESCLEILPSAGAQGICAGTGLIETGPNVLPLPENVVDIRITSEEQARLSKALASTPTATSATSATSASARAPALKAPDVVTPSLTVNARIFMNVREQPSLTAAIATTARRGAVLPVLGKSADGQWFQIGLADKTGWVLASLTLPNAGAQVAPVVE